MLKAGLYSAIVTTFITNFAGLSPDSGSATTQSGQPFEFTAFAARVNILWFLALILCLSCAFSAILMQQWARRYEELARRPRALHMRGRIRAYLFDGVNRFGMTRVVAILHKLLYISVFLLFAGLLDFLFQINTAVAYAPLGGIMISALLYAILATSQKITSVARLSAPLSGFMWSTFPFSTFRLFWSSRENYEGASGRLWSMYLTEAAKGYKETSISESLKRDTDGVPIFVSPGLVPLLHHCLNTCRRLVCLPSSSLTSLMKVSRG
jgi:hypothetical protein